MKVNNTLLLFVICIEFILIVIVVIIFIRMLLKLKEKPKINNEVDAALEKELNDNSEC